jgi:NADP-dependent 3-hydroxy acid dehydrogenase YdfG
LNAPGQRALAVATDVTVPGDVKRLVEAAVQTFGRIDVMVKNAGIMPNGAVYSATKHAVRALSEGLRQEVKDWNIRLP